MSDKNMSEDERDVAPEGEEGPTSGEVAPEEQESPATGVEAADVVDDGEEQAAETPEVGDDTAAGLDETVVMTPDEVATAAEDAQAEEPVVPGDADKTVVIGEPAQTEDFAQSEEPVETDKTVVMGAVPVPPTAASSAPEEAPAPKKQGPDRKKIIIAAVVAVIAVIVIALAWPCDHEWAEATCTEPATCTKCGKTDGEALGHNYAEATCTEPETCTRCGDTQGSALGHEWAEATCTEPETCERCGLTQGEALGHQVEEWTVTREATCSEEGEQEAVCTVCGETVTESIDKTEHTEGEWVTTKEPTATEDGERSLTCSVCGEVLETETIELSQIEKALLSFGTFDEVTVTGSGDDVVDIPCAGMPCVIEISYSGSRNFIIWTVDSSGEEVDLLVNEIGAYSGTVTTYTDYEDATMLSITASGSWSVTFKPMSAMEEATSGSSFKGDNVVLINTDELTKVSFTHSGSSNFIVWAVGMTDADLLVNEIGSYDGTVVWSQPQSFLIVSADGTWTVSW